jgi:hypothetical protein
MRIHDKAFASWVVFGLALLFTFPLLVLFLSRNSLVASLATLPGPVLVLLCFAWAWNLTLRSTRARRCGHSPLYLAHVVSELDAEDETVQRQAVRTLADFYDEPFGAVHLFWCRPEQLDALCVLYREWWRATQPSERKPAQSPEQVAAQAAAANLQPQVPPIVVTSREGAPDKAQVRGADHPPTPLLERLLLRLESNIWPDPPPQEPLCPPEAVLDRLPPLNREDFVRTLRITVEDALLLAADLINEVRGDAAFRRVRERIPDLFAGLGREALERGWQMRFDAEEEQKRQQQELSWAARFRRMKMTDLGLLPGSDPAEPAEPAAGGEPKAASWQEILQTLRAQLDQKLNRLADVIKDALLDAGAGSLSRETDQEPLPPLARAEFIEAMRGRVEQALGQMADVLDQSDHAEGVREVLAELLWDALNLSARLRFLASAPSTAPTSDSRN